MVALRALDPSIRQDMRYAGPDNFTGHPLPGYRRPECYLQRTAALALKRVQADLAARGLSLKVYDCYRPTRAIAGMARWAGDLHATPDARRFYPELNKAHLFALGYIASHSAHARGVAVDLTIVPREAKTPAFDPRPHYGSCAGSASAREPDDSLDMGTSFDCFDAKSRTHTTGLTPEQRANRDLLLQAMSRHGFHNYFREWWHFSYPAADPRQEYDFLVE
jgi:zinc D-Ala-D-Ala dipeptidase